MYIHSFNSSISARRLSGYRSTSARSLGMSELKAVLKVRMMSALSLFTIVYVFLSQRTGTVYFAAYSGSALR